MSPILFPLLVRTASGAAPGLLLCAAVAVRPAPLLARRAAAVRH